MPLPSLQGNDFIQLEGFLLSHKIKESKENSEDGSSEYICMGKSENGKMLGRPMGSLFTQEKKGPGRTHNKGKKKKSESISCSVVSNSSQFHEL